MRVFFLGLILLAVSSGVFAQDFGTYKIDKAWIVDVHDGDTVYIQDPTVPKMFGDRLGIRVNGIDTPEMHSQCTDPAAKEREQDLAKEAQALLKNKIDAAKTVEVDHVKDDKYGGRYVGDLMLDGTNVATSMLASGLALPYHGEKKVGWCDPANFPKRPN